MKNLAQHSVRGVTLIEILGIIAIIAILAGLAFPVAGPVSRRAPRRKAQMESS